MFIVNGCLSNTLEFDHGPCLLVTAVNTLDRITYYIHVRLLHGGLTALILTIITWVMERQEP